MESTGPGCPAGRKEGRIAGGGGVKTGGGGAPLGLGFGSEGSDVEEGSCCVGRESESD